MPRPRPPKRTRAGTLYARPGARDGAGDPGLPLGPLDGDRGRGASPLGGLELPEPSVEPRAEIAVRRLDAGRLYAPDLVEAAGWTTLLPLAADLTQSHRIRLSPAVGVQRPVRGTKSPHVDREGRIIVPSGLRAFLSLANGDHLLAWTTGDGVVHLAPADVLPAVFAAYDRGIPSPEDADPAADGVGATVHRLDPTLRRRGS